MAKAYLGKISALVTANTSDFNSKLNASAKEVRSFASAMQSSLTRAESAATASLRGIYTESQKVSRALQAVSSKRLDFKGFDTSTFAKLQQAVDTFKQIQNAATNIFDPLASAARVVDRLSASVQREFDPAMKSAQRSAEFLNQQLAQGGIVGERAFERIRRQAEAAAQAADRLAEAEALAGRGPRGTELAFAAPRVRDTLTASAAARQRAAEAPAALLEDGRIARDVQKLASIDALIVKRRAQIEQGIALNVDTTQAQRSLENLAALSERVRNRVEGSLNESNAGRAAADNEIALLQRRERAAKEAEDRRIAGQQRVADNEIALLQRREQAAKEVESRRLAEQQRAEDNEIALLQRREQTAKEIEDRRLADQQRQQENETAALIRREQAAKDAESRRLDEARGSQINPGDALARRARALIGGDIPDGNNVAGRALEIGRQVDNIGQRIEQARRQIDGLPDGIRAGLVPELRRASDIFVDLSRLGARATADQIARANREAERLARNANLAQRGLRFGEQFGGPGRRGLEFGLQEVSLRGYTAQLQVLQRALAGAGSEARGPALNAFNQLRSAISQATARGTLDTRAVRQEIARLTDEATRAAAAAAGISPGRLGRSVQRAGDIGRNSFANLGLGIQQAVFAVEDFFSVTGGLDQRIRAAGNNLSQLGFILGGTQGLIVGVAAAIGGQLVAAYLKWQNQGVGTEDSVKSLNDALSRQKSIIESIAESFSSLADEVGRIGFSKQGADAAQFANQLEEIRKKQQEFNTERAAALDPAVQQQRGIINARERELEKASDPADRVRLSRAIVAARREEQDAIARIREARPVGAFEAASVAIESRRQVEVQRAREAGLVGDEQRANARARNAAAGIGGRIGNARTQEGRNEVAILELSLERQRLEQEINANNFIGAGFLAGGNNTVRKQQLALVEAALISLQSGAANAADAIELEVAKASRAAAERIGVAQDAVAKAIEAGIPGAASLKVQLDALVEQLTSAQRRLVSAQQAGRDSGRGGDVTAAERAQREVRQIQLAINAREEEARTIAAVAAAVKQFDDVLQSVSRGVDSNVQSARDASDTARQRDLFSGTRTTADARRRAEDAAVEQGRLARRAQAEIAAARERFLQDALAAPRRSLAAEARANDEVTRQIIRESGAQVPGLRTLDEFIAELDARGLRQQAEQVRQNRDRQISIAEQLGNPKDFWGTVASLLEQSSQQASDVASQIGQPDQVWGTIASLLERSSSQASDAVLRAIEAAQIDRQLSTVGVLADGAREVLARKRAELESLSIEQDPAVRNAVDASMAESMRVQSVERGRQFAMSDAARSGEELAAKLRDISVFFADKIDQNNGLPDPAIIQDLRSQQKRAAEEAMRATAPAIFNMADEAQNAVLQGPSRAALQVADVTTSQGQSELNRLLRGDDSSRSASLVELQKQSQKLAELVDIARRDGAWPGIFDN